MLNIEPGLLIWTIITFIILLIILRKVAWAPILGALEQRDVLSGVPLKRHSNHGRKPNSFWLSTNNSSPMPIGKLLVSSNKLERKRSGSVTLL